MKEITTLDKIEDPKDWTLEEAYKRNALTLLMSQLSNLQSSCAFDLEQLYRKHGVYNFTIKHNHKRIMDLIEENQATQFYKRLSYAQKDVYIGDANNLEDMIYAWAGITKPETSPYIDVPCVNLNLMGIQAFDCAKKRGKITDYTTDLIQLNAIKDEFNELRSASTNPSIHIEGYTEQQEEAADVIIATLTFLTRKGVDINKLLEKKMEYNTKRLD